MTESQVTYSPDPATRPGLHLGQEQERRLRQWPTDRIRPKSVALGVISLLAEVDALRAELATRPVVQRRDNWSRDQVRSLRRKVKNLRAELLKQAEPRRRDRAHAYDRGMAAGMRAGDIKFGRIADTLSLMAQQQAWYRLRFKHMADLLRSDDWRGRALKGDTASFLNGLAWLAEDALRQPMFPDAAPKEMPPTSEASR